MQSLPRGGNEVTKGWPLLTANKTAGVSSECEYVCVCARETERDSERDCIYNSSLWTRLLTISLDQLVDLSGPSLLAVKKEKRWTSALPLHISSLVPHHCHLSASFALLFCFLVPALFHFPPALLVSIQAIAPLTLHLCAGLVNGNQCLTMVDCFI